MRSPPRWRTRSQRQPEDVTERIGHANVGVVRFVQTYASSETTTARQPSRAASFRLGKAGDPVAEADSQCRDRATFRRRPPPWHLRHQVDVRIAHDDTDYAPMVRVDPQLLLLAHLRQSEKEGCRIARL
jgi:hypothetical protein